MNILLVEDNIAQGTTIVTICRAKGFAVEWAKTGAFAEELVLSGSFGCILLDYVLPDGSGEDILRRIRKRSDPTPIIMMSGQAGVVECIRLLDAGADDFISKPYHQDELFARINSAIRRRSVCALPEIRVGTLIIRRAERLVERDGAPLGLSPREWAVLECLLNRVGRLVERHTIESALYDFGSEIESNTVEVYVSRLRKKIGRDRIETVRGYGYKLVAK
ncbi:response regulator transcription factor [Rhizobium leguminosarum]|uniref:response regulator transcription factor n=1 Tax=Rhizobium leguminosarum TaxID=384 RepID=UPI001C9225C5|nr:response regulator transcription factor [Rhizobium leguminosarum]MBY3179990.1 response regulator transcription factor [Rhizobium leguminosarum]